MPHGIDQDYFAGRAKAEIEAGDLALNARVAAVHYELAYRYSLLAAVRTVGRPKLVLVQGGEGQMAA